jgi:hypothetical protein
MVEQLDISKIFKDNYVKSCQEFQVDPLSQVLRMFEQKQKTEELNISGTTLHVKVKTFFHLIQGRSSFIFRLITRYSI